MFRLVANVKRGVSSNFDEVWRHYGTLDAARAAGRALSSRERVGHVLIVEDDVSMRFVEWVS